jgi:hypothetical protein
VSVEIGDAIMRFLADSTQLDEAFATLPAKAEAAMGPAAASVAQVGAAADAVSLELDATAENAAYAGEEINAGMTKGAGSVRRLSEEARVAEEMVGIRLPRGVTRFVAELPGLSTALSLAFDASIVFFLIEAVVQAAEKLSTFAANTFIYTEAAKAAYTAQVALNQKFLETSQAIEKAKTAVEEYGLTAGQKTQQAIEANNAAFVRNTATIQANKDEIARLTKEQQDSAASAESMAMAMDGYTPEVKDNSAAIQDLANKNALLAKGMEALNMEMKVLQLQMRDQEDAARKESAQKQAAYDQARIAAAATVGNALLALQKAEVEASVAFDDDAAVRRLMVDKIFAEASYQLDLSTRREKLAAQQQAENQSYQITRANLENRLAVEKSMGASGVAAVAATQVQIEQLAISHNLKLRTDAASGNAEIEALEKNHEAKVIQDATKFRLEFESIIKAAFAPDRSNRMGLAESMLGLDFNDKFGQAEKAAQTLGITLGGTLAQDVAKAQAAYTTLKNSGVASTHDLMIAQLKLLEVQLKLEQSMGGEFPGAVKATKKAIEDLNKDLKTFEGETGKSERLWDLFTKDFKKKAKEMGTSSEQMAKLLSQSLEDLQSAEASAIAAAILSEDSLGSALEKATAQMLAQLAAQAAVKAIYFTAMGIAELAWGVTTESAAEWFHAAALMGIVAGAAGVAGHAMAGGGSSTGPTMTTGTPAVSPAGTATHSANVPHLQGGGLITAPTLAMLGEGGRREGVIPLNDASALNAIGEALAKHMGDNSGVTHIWQVKGMVSSDTAGKLMKKMSRQVQTGRARLIASNAHKITRRA